MDRYAQSGTSNPELRVVKAVMTSCSAPSERRLDSDVQQLVEVETTPGPQVREDLHQVCGRS